LVFKNIRTTFRGIFSLLPLYFSYCLIGFIFHHKIHYIKVKIFIFIVQVQSHESTGALGRDSDIG